MDLQAHTILQLAASPLHFPHESPSDGFAALGPYPCYLQSPSVKVGPASPGTVFSTLQTGKAWPLGHSNSVPYVTCCFYPFIYNLAEDRIYFSF